MDLGAPPGSRPQDYYTLRMGEVFGWLPDDLEGLTLQMIHEAYIYSQGDE